MGGCPSLYHLFEKTWRKCSTVAFGDFTARLSGLHIVNDSGLNNLNCNMVNGNANSLELAFGFICPFSNTSITRLQVVVKHQLLRRQVSLAED